MFHLNTWHTAVQHQTPPLEHEVCHVTTVGLQGEEWGQRCLQPEIFLICNKSWINETKSHYLSQSSVSIPVTNTKLVPLLGEHDPVHLGEDAPGSVSDHLGVVTPLPERHRAILSTTDVEWEVGVSHQPSDSVALVSFNNVTRTNRFWFGTHCAGLFNSYLSTGSYIMSVQNSGGRRG